MASISSSSVAAWFAAATARGGGSPGSGRDLSQDGSVIRQLPDGGHHVDAVFSRQLRILLDVDLDHPGLALGQPAVPFLAFGAERVGEAQQPGAGAGAGDSGEIGRVDLDRVD